MYIEDDGIKLNAKLDMPKDAQDKCPLCIVLHGFTGHIEEDHIVAAAQAMNEVGVATLRVDLYGHGNSQGEFRNHTLFKWLTNVMTIIDYAKTLDFVTDMYICGHSQGGLTAMIAAGMESDVFTALIALSPALVIPDGARKGNLLGQPFDPVHIPDELVSWDDRRLSGNYIRVAQTIDVDTYISKFTGPTLIVHGDEDEAVPVEYSIDAAPKYANGTLKLIAGDDHCYGRHLDQVVGAIKEFLQEIQ
ncbi:MAG: lysophospholipase [Pseudobutyrivibrio sp.]|nr:lysophospholipase [Pseudobutyrivibrio sp.]